MRKHSHKTEAALHSYKRLLPTHEGSSTAFLTFSSWWLDELNKRMFHVASLPECIHSSIQLAVGKHSEEPPLWIRMASILYGDPHIYNNWINISPIKTINTKIETTKYSLFQFPLLTNIFRKTKVLNCGWSEGNWMRRPGWQRFPFISIPFKHTNFNLNCLQLLTFNKIFNRWSNTTQHNLVIHLIGI